jgi:hypothetical protein
MKFSQAIHISTLRMRTEMIFEILIFSLFNHLTQLIAQENFIISVLVLSAEYGKCRLKYM